MRLARLPFRSGAGRRPNAPLSLSLAWYLAAIDIIPFMGVSSRNFRTWTRSLQLAIHQNTRTLLTHLLLIHIIVSIRWSACISVAVFAPYCSFNSKLHRLLSRTSLLDLISYFFVQNITLEIHSNMAPLNTGTSVYHRIQAMYWRSAEGSLVAVEGRCANQVQKSWVTIWENLSHSLQTSACKQVISNEEVVTTTLRCPCLEVSDCTHCTGSHTLRVRELPNRKQSLTFGLIINVEGATDIANADLHNWAEIFFLLETRCQPFPDISSNRSNSDLVLLAERIADLFDTTLRNVPAADEWLQHAGTSNGSGRAYFANRVFGFVSQNKPIEFGLPAFPCKSPNARKVGGVAPDAAEFLALGVLRNFLAEIAAVYSPGAVLWIISDGHVFSDCSELLSLIFHRRRILGSY